MRAWPIACPASLGLGSIALRTENEALWSGWRLSTRRRRPVPAPVFHWKALSTFAHGAVVILRVILCAGPLRGLILTATTWRAGLARWAGGGPRLEGGPRGVPTLRP